jgi:hypothetical protein
MKMEPDDPTFYFPYYMGEFDKDGLMKPTCQKFEYHTDGPPKEIQRDPYLYWLIPIMRVPVTDEAPRPAWFNLPVSRERPKPDEYKLVNFVTIHTGDEMPGFNIRLVPAGGEEQ